MSRPGRLLRVQLAGVTHAAMEATGGYWTPVWNVFDGQFTEMSLVNAHGTVSVCVLRWMFVTSRHHDRFRVAAAQPPRFALDVDIPDEANQQLDEAQTYLDRLKRIALCADHTPNGVRL